MCAAAGEQIHHSQGCVWKGGLCSAHTHATVSSYIHICLFLNGVCSDLRHAPGPGNLQALRGLEPGYRARQTLGSGWVKDAQASLSQAYVLCSGAGMEGALEAAVGGLGYLQNSAWVQGAWWWWCRQKQHLKRSSFRTAEFSEQPQS